MVKTQGVDKYPKYPDIRAQEYKHGSGSYHCLTLRKYDGNEYVLEFHSWFVDGDTKSRVVMKRPCYAGRRGERARRDAIYHWKNCRNEYATGMAAINR